MSNMPLLPTNERTFDVEGQPVRCIVRVPLTNEKVDRRWPGSVWCWCDVWPGAERGSWR